MARLFLIRHGEPEVAWGAGGQDDPGLSERGRAQAARAAEALAAKGALAAASSPMRRCLETAAPYLQHVGVAAAATPAEFGEVATPAIADRRAWLLENFPWRDGLAPRYWNEVTPELRAWRDAVIEAASAIRADTAVFTHFIASNVIVGAAMQSPHTIVFRPDYASITELDVRDGLVVLRRLGEEMREGEVR